MNPLIRLGLVLTMFFLGCEASVDSALDANEQAVSGGELDTTYLAVGRVANSGCSATLIAPRLVLSAAHCVHTATDELILDGIGRFPGTWRTHSAEENLDSAVLELRSTPPVTPIPVSAKAVGPGTSVTLVGYGQIAPNDHVFVRRVGTNTVGTVSSFFYGTTSDNGNGICPGDSGGPLLAVVDGQTQVIGVNSYILGQCGSGWSYYSRADADFTWITRGLARPPKPLPAEGATVVPDGGSVTLSWTAVPGARFYALGGVDLTDGSYNEGARRLPGNICGAAPQYLCQWSSGPSFTLPVTTGHRYAYWVHACFDAGCSDASRTQFVTGNLPEHGPQGLSPNGQHMSSGARGAPSARLSWEPVPGAQFYALGGVDLTDPAYNVGALRVPGGVCGDVPQFICHHAYELALSIPVVSGHTYRWWVHACANGQCNAASVAEFTEIVR